MQSFVLSTDAANPTLEVPFHLIVRVHVRERVASIDNLELPILAELELLGDTREMLATPAGTDYKETISVVAHHTGTISIAPATLQAIDARDGKPKQYFSNALTIRVGGGTLEPLAGSERFAARAMREAARAAVFAGGVLCAIAVFVFVFRFAKRAPLAAPEPPAPPPPPAPPRSRRDRFSDALTVLRAERSRAAAVRVRSAVWRMIGASDGETLADVLALPDAAQPHVRELLRSLERAAFTYDADLPAAIDHACASLEAMLS